MKQLALAATVAVATLAMPADAQTYRFDLTGSYTASWTLDAFPTPAVAFSGIGFQVNDVQGRFDGIAGGLADITFYDAAESGGLEIDDPAAAGVIRLIADGPQLYSGDATAPRLLTGTFALTQFNGAGRYTLSVAEAAVPEPAGWALMLLGFGAAGTELRARRQRVAFA